MKIILSTSPHIKHASVLESDFQPRNDLMYTFAPLGLLSLCAAMRESIGITPLIYDINSAINSNEIVNSRDFYVTAAQSILENKPDILGFMTECDSYHHVLQVCEEVKKINTDCFIVLGGPHATAVGEATLKKWRCIDCVIAGEGEISFTALVHHLMKKKEGIVLGAFMRDKKGNVNFGKNRPLIQDLDDLPYPAYDLYTPLEGEELFMEVGRGCPFECTFCSTSPFWDRKHRVKSPKRIVNEITYIKTLHDCKRIHFTHDLFTANQKWVEEVCNALITANLKVKWTCSSRVDTVTESLLELMSKAGCSAIFFGIESGSDVILEKIKKKITLKDTEKVIELCKTYNITPNAGLIVGFPFETEQSFKDTFDAYLNLLKLGVKPLHIFSYCPFAQSSMYNTLKGLELYDHFLDIPLPEKNRLKNRSLIKNDQELFGSYFRVPLQKTIEQLHSGMIYGIDEFALLVDTVRIPSILIGEYVGGMDTLFFKWTKHIVQKNKIAKKANHRKYFGSPNDFIDFLLLIYNSDTSGFPPYLFDVLRVTKKNFEISLKISYKQPTTMATYRSKTIAESLTNISFKSTVALMDILDYVKLDYNILAVLNSSTVSNYTNLEPHTVNLIWQLYNEGIKLIQVNDFIYYVVEALYGKYEYSLEEIINNWQNSERFDASVDVGVLINEIINAQEKKIVIIN